MLNVHMYVHYPQAAENWERRHLSPTKMFSDVGVPLKCPGGRKIGEYKEKEEKIKKIVKLLIGSKQMGYT